MSNSSFFALFKASHVISPLHLILDEKQQTIYTGRIHPFFSACSRLLVIEKRKTVKESYTKLL